MTIPCSTATLSIPFVATNATDEGFGYMVSLLKTITDIQPTPGLPAWDWCDLGCRDHDEQPYVGLMHSPSLLGRRLNPNSATDAHDIVFAVFDRRHKKASAKTALGALSLEDLDDLRTWDYFERDELGAEIEDLFAQWQEHHRQQFIEQLPSPSLSPTRKM